ncbi:hypothetical protein BZA03_101842 [Alteromonas sp. I10]|jgi:hypothetical protein|uniref:hypothetical protein n=1 Tax=Alteromonas TaxID=226 RepID=UPI00041D8016|nr:MULTISPECIES: hypothetical protein [Alteromonas]PXW77367.1 hypothetical protein BZA03_101842 [Alteromonas sp. I10]
MRTDIKNRTPYGSTRRRIVVCADKTTESHILEAQSRLSDLTGIKPSLSVAIAYLVKEGHKATATDN